MRVTVAPFWNLMTPEICLVLVSIYNKIIGLKSRLIIIQFNNNRKQTYLDSIVQLDVWVWESDGSSVVSNNVWNLLLANALLDNLAELEGSLLIVNLVWVESSLGVVENSEILISFFNCDNVLLSEWESWVSSDLSVNLDQTLLVLDDFHGLISVQSILESLHEEYVEGNAFSEFVGTWGWSGSINSLKFTKIPLLWSGNSLNDFSLSFIALKR